MFLLQKSKISEANKMLFRLDKLIACFATVSGSHKRPNYHVVRYCAQVVFSVKMKYCDFCRVG